VGIITDNNRGSKSFFLGNEFWRIDDKSSIFRLDRYLIDKRRFDKNSKYLKGNRRIVDR